MLLMVDGGMVLAFCELGLGLIWFDVCLWCLGLLAVFCFVLADQDLILLFSNVVFCWWCWQLVRWWFDGRVGLPVICYDVGKCS